MSGAEGPQVDLHFGLLDADESGQISHAEWRAGYSQEGKVSTTPPAARIAKDSPLNQLGSRPQAPPGLLAEDDGSGTPEQTAGPGIEIEPSIGNTQKLHDDGEPPSPKRRRICVKTKPGAKTSLSAKVWESRGTGSPDEEAKAEEGKSIESGKKETGSAAAAQVGAASSSSGQGAPKRVIKRLEKQSGESGIHWVSLIRGWGVRFQLANKTVFRTDFPTNKYIAQGYSENDAETKTLEDAKACKRDLVHRGIIKDSTKRRDPMYSSEVPGVSGTQVKSSSEQAHHKSNYRGVIWLPSERCWLAQLRQMVDGKSKRLSFRARPRDESQEEVDWALQAAIAWWKEQNRRKVKVLDNMNAV